LPWQRVRESNPCTSLERAYAFPRVRFAVARLLLDFDISPARFCGCVGVADESPLSQRSGGCLSAISARIHVYEIRPRKDRRGYDLISDALPSGGLWYLEVRQAIDFAKHQSRSHHPVIRVYDEACKLIEVH
jgi:hypothetical protein